MRFEMPNFLKEKEWLGKYKWYRKWYGGKWSLWSLEIKCGPIWDHGFEKPLFGVERLEIEEY